MIKKLYCFIISLLIFALIPVTIFAEDATSTYNLDSGISISLPEEYSDFAIYSQAPEDSTGWKLMGFPSYSLMLDTIQKDRIEFMSYRNDVNENYGFAVRITNYDVPEELSNENLFSIFCEKNRDIYDSINEAPVLGYGIVKIKDVSFFKVYFEADESIKEIMFTYLLPTNDGIIHEISFRNHANTSEPYHLDSLAHNAISTLVLSNELISKTIPLNNEKFTMINGHHLALFEFENIDGKTVIDNPVTVEKTLYQKFISFEFPIWIIGVALIVLLLFGAQVSKKGQWVDKPLSLEHSKIIQGFSALAIIIHHLSQELTLKAGVLSFFSELGVLFVGVFFFFSGYGLYTSLETKQNYLKGFLKKRLISVLIPLYVCILIFTLSACINGQTFSLPEVLTTLSGWILISSHMWYVIEIAILYLAFYIIYSLVKNRKIATSLMAIFVVFLEIGSLLLGHGADLSSKYWFMGEWWYNTTLAFVLGIVVSQNQNSLRSFARKFYFILLPIFTGLTIGFYYETKNALINYSYWNEFPGHPGYKEKFICLGIQQPWVLFFVITVVLIMMKVRFKNKVLTFLGSISLELYLIHNLFLMGFHDNSIMSIKSASLYMILTILVSIGFAYLINGFNQYLIELALNKQKRLELKNNQTSTNSNSKIHSIDVLRIVMAFLVITIHMPFNTKVGEIFITYGKIAVPFFLVVCGYFLYRNNSKEMMPRLKKQAIRILIFYIASNVIYAIANIIKASIDGYSIYYTIKQYLDLLLYNMSPFSEHLWFFGSLLYALVILMILNKFKLVDYAMFISPLLIGAYVLLSHLNITEGYVLRNAILVGLPYTMMGMLIRRYEDRLMKIKTIILWIIMLVLAITAILELNTYPQGINVPFISCEISVYIIVLLCLNYPNFGKDTLAEKMGKELSLPIYVLHILVLMFITYIIPANTGLIAKYGAITVFIITAFIASIYKTTKNLITSKAD